MENMRLTEQELKLFGDMFAICDTENTGKVSGPKASELFITSGLSHEVLHEIIILCGAKRLGHFGRSQFYIALKLIAAVQHGFPLHLDSISSGRDIPLPILGGVVTVPVVNATYRHHPVQPPAHPQQRMQMSFEQVPHVNQGMAVQTAVVHADAPTSPPTSPQQIPQQGAMVMNVSSLKQLPAAMRSQLPQHQQQHYHPQQMPGAVTHLPHNAGVPMHPPGVVPPGVFPTAQQFETNHSNQQPQAHPNHTAPGRPGLEKGWASFEDDNQGLLSEDKKEWTCFTDSSRAETSSLSSETDSIDDTWLISDELRKYYLQQFLTMQPDVKGLVSGAVAKDFFEKSKLPISELSKIWQLSDVNKDGALNLEEFNTAMHLVVCRINGVDLPDKLPPSLMPYVPFTNSDEPFASDLPPGSTLKRLTPSSPGSTSSANQWASASNVSSPGQKPTPLSFEFKPIKEDQDSTIVHPVALRMSPDGQAFPVDTNNKPVVQSHIQQDSGGNNSQDLSPNSEPPGSSTAVAGTTRSGSAEKLVDIREVAEDGGHVIYQPKALQPRPRPTPKKTQSVPGSGQDNSAVAPTATSVAPLVPPPPPSSSQDNMAVVSGGAPVPPPRTKSHSRSSSLDANQMLTTYEKGTAENTAPPMIPPRPKEGASSSTEMSSSTMSASVTSPSEERKVTPQHSGDDLDGRLKAVPKQDSEEKAALRARVRQQREKNLTLSRLNSELNQELQEVMEQRIALEIQMEHLRPYYGGYS